MASGRCAWTSPGARRITWPGVSFAAETDTTQYTVLVFDAYNPQEGALPLNWRIDLADGGKQFGGTRLDAESSTPVEVWISALGPIDRVLIYRRMPRTDATIYLDNVHWATVEDRFEPIDYVDPPMGDEAGGPSTGRIGAREGVDDYRYVHTLRRAIARAEASDNADARRAAAEAREELERIVASIDYSPRVRGTAKWTESTTLDDGTRTIGGTLKLPNGRSHAEYEVHRWIVAEHTMRIMAALGEIEGQ